jgi:cytochrome c553
LWAACVADILGGRGTGDIMRIIIALLALLLLPGHAVAADGPDWAYPATPTVRPKDDGALIRVPGSDKSYTQTQIDDAFNPPDWFPAEHPAMPEIVQHGEAKAVRACALCHLPTGAGHPESSSLAGLSVAYLLRAMAEFKNGERKGIRTTVMITFAKAISDEDARTASEYFAHLKPAPWTKVEERAQVPKSFVGAGGMRFVEPQGGSEPIGHRIIELPQNEAGAIARNPHTGFVAYVPPGSIARGKKLVTTGGGKTVPCAICHGQSLKGITEVARLAGRSPIYLFRQLNDMKDGNRIGSMVELMAPVVAKLSQDDMIAIAAYVGSLNP